MFYIEEVNKKNVCFFEHFSIELSTSRCRKGF